MAAPGRMVLLVTVAAIFSQPTLAQQSKEVTVAEPGTYELTELFNRADTVALVRVVSGDTESYSVALYKAEVVKSFKGPAAGETIYFGPYEGKKLGSEYILFLRSVSEPIQPKTKPNAGYGTVHYAEVFNQGYSSMETSYECVFDGQKIARKCDYAVRVCTDYVKLPKRTPTFPPVTEDTAFGCRSVRKTVFISLLEAIGNPRK